MSLIKSIIIGICLLVTIPCYSFGLFDEITNERVIIVEKDGNQIEGIIKKVIKRDLFSGVSSKEVSIDKDSRQKTIKNTNEESNYGDFLLLVETIDDSRFSNYTKIYLDYKNVQYIIKKY